MEPFNPTDVRPDLEGHQRALAIIFARLAWDAAHPAEFMAETFPDSSVRQGGTGSASSFWQ